MDNHMQLVQQILEENHFNKPALQEMATRWGLPISLITSAAASPKTLQQLVAAGHIPGSLTSSSNSTRTTTTCRKHENISRAAASYGVGTIFAFVCSRH